AAGPNGFSDANRERAVVMVTPSTRAGGRRTRTVAVPAKSPVRLLSGPRLCRRGPPPQPPRPPRQGPVGVWGVGAPYPPRPRTAPIPAGGRRVVAGGGSTRTRSTSPRRASGPPPSTPPVRP